MVGSQVMLVEVLRGSTLESLHTGSVAVSDSSGKIVFQAGDPFTVAFWRSAMKPLQAMAFAESGALEAYGLGEEALALACGSHEGEARHLEVVDRMLKAGGLSTADYRCGAHPPRTPDHEALLSKGQRPDPRHNNCSGKHAGMLLATKRKDLPLPTYLDPSHPHQARIRELA